MKLAPRERRVRSDFLLDNAANLELGKLFLGWRKKKTHTKAAKKDKVVETKAGKAATPAKKPAATPKKAAAPKPKTAAAKKAAPKPKAAAKKGPSAKAKPTSKAKAAPAKKAAAGMRGRPRQYSGSAPPASQKRSRSPEKPRQAPAAPAAAPKAKSVVQRRPRRPAAPPVIPNPVPTPALPAFSPADPVESVDSSQMVTITVRTMNGSSFRLVLTLDTTLYDLKRQILGVIAPGPPSPQTFLRLPMLVMNGRALMPDNVSLRTLRFTALSTVYCFPEPN